MGFFLLFACALYALRVDYMSAFTLNKLYVGIFALLALSPGLFRDVGGRWLTSVITGRVIQWTLILQYFAAGLAKANGDWLKDGDVLLSQVLGVFRTEGAAWALNWLPEWTWTAQQQAALGFKLFAPLLFAHRRLLPVAVVMGFGFHFLIAVFMKDLIYFSLQMWTFYAMFISAKGWQRMGIRWQASA